MACLSALRLMCGVGDAPHTSPVHTRLRLFGILRAFQQFSRLGTRPYSRVAVELMLIDNRPDDGRVGTPERSCLFSNLSAPSVFLNPRFDPPLIAIHMLVHILSINSVVLFLQGAAPLVCAAKQLASGPRGFVVWGKLITASPRDSQLLSQCFRRPVIGAFLLPLSRRLPGFPSSFSFRCASSVILASFISFDQRHLT